MKILFIPTKLRAKPNKSKILEISKQLPKNIAIAYSIQYQDIASEINKILSKNHKITKFTQVLGCSNPVFPQPTQAILLIGDGRFHATSLAIETKLPIYILEKEKITKIKEQDINEFKTKQKASYLKFLHSDKVGILVSTKPGQQNLKKALQLKNKLKKKSYILIGNNLNTAEFENFGLDSYINTACPRLDMDDARVVNINNIPQ
ncbi:MAG: diphthamide synthesis protein [archaeon]